jgi:hypothetical protein
MNRAQRLVMVLTTMALIGVILRATILKPACINAMCPVNDQTLFPRLGIVIGAGTLAWFVLRSPRQNAPQPDAHPDSPTQNP